MRIDNNLLFKGYISLGGDNGKKPIVGNWPNNTSEYNSLEMRNGIGGVLNEFTVLVDIDDMYQAEKLLDIVKSEDLHCEVRKTNRGYHFFFWNQKGKISKSPSHVYAALGLEVDYKVGTSNTYAVIKQSGKDREIIYSNPITDDNNNPIGYEELPCYLRLIDKKDRSFLDMREGDGRNSAIFSYIPTLLAHNFSEAEIQETLTIINKYIFAEPLDNRELEKAMREILSTTQTKDDKPPKGNRLGHDAIGDQILVDFRTINNKLYVYKDGYYQSNPRYIEQKITQNHKSIKQHLINEVYCYLKRNAQEGKPEDFQYLIPFRNGNYDLRTGTLCPHSKDVCVVYQIPHNYNPDAYSKTADCWLDSISDGNEPKRQLLEELLGVCICPFNKYQKAFHLYGKGANGKSIFLDVIMEVVGKENCSFIALDKLGDRFNMQAFWGKLVNISDETPENTKKAAEAIKQLTGNSPLSAEAKYANERYDFINVATIISAGNNIPDFDFSDGGMKRRMIIIEFTAMFVGDRKNPDIEDQLKEEDSLEYLIRLGIEGLKRVSEKGWSFTEDGAKNIDDIMYERDSVYAFIINHGKRNIIGKALDEVYAKYIEFCKLRDISPQSDKMFSKRIGQYTGMNLKPYTISGKSKRLFSD